MTLVLTEKRDGIALVTINRPDTMNALSAALRDELAATIEVLEADVDTRVLILTGARFSKFFRPHYCGCKWRGGHGRF